MGKACAGIGKHHDEKRRVIVFLELCTVAETFFPHPISTNPNWRVHMMPAHVREFIYSL